MSTIGMQIAKRCSLRTENWFDDLELDATHQSQVGDRVVRDSRPQGVRGGLAVSQVQKPLSGYHHLRFFS